ncbi:MAG: Rieske 2Fe-2S domain-containing protein [Gammaproteobacteria bacterium]|nr:Rieske 2Fe-2S domain-containing protein [Gammaproteobacteria bacterium]
MPHRGFVVRRGGVLVAYRNICPHAGRPLNWHPDRFLDQRGEVILCTGHGAEFAIASGACGRGPCKGQSLSALRVDLIDGVMFIDTGQPAPSKRWQAVGSVSRTG